MTKEDKELLLRYLSMALQYEVKVTTTSPAVKIGVISGISIKNKISIEIRHAIIVFDYTEVKPYLRPMSSMTEEEMDIYANTGSFLCANGIPYNLIYTTEGLLFLLRKHFDIFDLIPKGLAIEVTEENNPYNIKEVKV